MIGNYLTILSAVLSGVALAKTEASAKADYHLLYLCGLRVLCGKK